jgi:hypothetical protein
MRPASSSRFEREPPRVFKEIPSDGHFPRLIASASQWATSTSRGVSLLALSPGLRRRLVENWVMRPLEMTVSSQCHYPASMPLPAQRDCLIYPGFRSFVFYAMILAMKRPANFEFYFLLLQGVAP